MRFNSEFEKYAIQHVGIGSLALHNHNKQGMASLTPYILEEREMRVTQMDIFSRMMLDRIIWFCHPVTNETCTITQAQLMFLDNLDQKDITLQISSPGGSVTSGLSLLDTMDYVSSDIVTINLGMAASMGSVLLGGGKKGKRFGLKNSRVMLHTVSSGTEGKVQDMLISYKEAEKYNDILFGYLAGFCGKTKEEVLKDADRDFWMDSEQSVKYGIIDAVIKNKKDIKIKK